MVGLTHRASALSILALALFGKVARTVRTPNHTVGHSSLLNSKASQRHGFFKGLAALRAVAAVVVVLGHIELQKERAGIPVSIRWPDGHLAVVLFFVLSGFLISHLLVSEKEETGRIGFRNFYVRRILRIWPLYYLIVLASFLLVRAPYDTTSTILTLGIVPNFAAALGLGWPSSPQIWSIGVEEQFYILLPLLVRWIPTRNLAFLMVLFFGGYTLLPHAIGFINQRTVQSASIDVVYRFFFGTKFNSMSVGCVLGVLVASRPDELSRAESLFLRLLYWRPLALVAILLSFTLWFAGVTFWYFTDEVYSCLFGITILNLATNAEIGVNLEREPFKLLGKISYGIYMYHWLVILLFMGVLPYEAFRHDFAYNIALYAAVLATTVAVSWLSFVTFEAYFLNKKGEFLGAICYGHT